MKLPAASLRVSVPPPRPLMIFDGDCHFCGLWIARWQEITGDAVEYAPLQTAAANFPEIPRAHLEQAVHLLDADGTVRSGAAAVCGALAHGGWMNRLAETLYRHAPGFAQVSEFAYGLVARHRAVAAAVTRVLWGSEVRRPTYHAARAWFLRALGAIYLLAFASLWLQLDGLVGSHGILPAAEFLHAAREHFGPGGVVSLPTLAWWNASDFSLHLLCAGGVVFSLLLLVGLAPTAMLGLLFVAYLSLTVVGQTFLSFQWDVLLLEAGFLAMFFAPRGWLPARSRNAPVSGVGLFGLKALLFKLMVMSAVVKLTSGDTSWWDLTALNYHYETQPLPTPLAWWAHGTPAWVRQFSALAMYAVELGAPLFLWAPRHLRLAAGTALFALQLAIAATGNYGFFNLLVAAFCLLLIDDAVWPFPRRTIAVSAAAPRQWAGIAALALTLPLNAAHLVSAFRPEMEWPRPLAALYRRVEPFRIANPYGLFRVMTRTRPEIIVEGSADGANWQPYEFRWKPGDPARRPSWVAPYQPRLDWQMWFAALGNPSTDRWFVAFAERLLKNEPSVVALLARNPFPAGPPRYLRATLYDYRFTNRAESARGGPWWKREKRGEYLPVVSLPDR